MRKRQIVSQVQNCTISTVEAKIYAMVIQFHETSRRMQYKFKFTVESWIYEIIGLKNSKLIYQIGYIVKKLLGI